jgi:predicted transcriptional regulator of viral defense system
MKFQDFIQRVKDRPVIETESLLVGEASAPKLAVEISRWQKAGRLIQLKRGVYVLSETYRKVEVSEFHLAGVLNKPSYVSLEKALEYYGLIPEAVPVYTSVTTKRPGRLKTPLGVFDYRHIRSSLFWGYKSLVLNKQMAFIATPEKALLDLFYLRPVKVTADYLSGMRLQNVEVIRKKGLLDAARRFGKPKMTVAAEEILAYVREYQKRMKKA